VLWRPEAVRGDRWAADPDPALLAITVADVTAAVTEALAASPPHGSGAAHPRPIP
jgi:hypothetical protein